MTKLNKEILKATAHKVARKAKPLAKKAAMASKPFVKEVAFHPTIRSAIRASGVGNSPVSKKLKLSMVTQALTSEQLPPGQYYARITIKDWAKYKNVHFRLFEKGRLVYGNTIEQPQRGFALEYRNIVVTSNSPEDFTLDINASFTISFKEGTFTTKHQDDFDTKYGVIQDGDLFYSARGNLSNPKKVIVTFPGFGPSATRTSYAVTYFKELTDSDLRNTAIICFQDRYGVAGTYMQQNHSGAPIMPQVEKLLRKFLNSWDLTDNDMIFFGASKGGTIALTAAEAFPHTELILVIPQLDLPSFTSKPFFKDNIYLYDSFHQQVQPGDLLLRYIHEGRKISHYFSNSDELSNASIPEFVTEYANYQRFRINGTHGEVTRRCLASATNQLRQFFGTPKTTAVPGGSFRLYLPQGDEVGIGVQVKVPREFCASPEANVFLRMNKDGVIFNQILTHNAVPGIFFTEADQRLIPGLDPLDSELSLVAMNPDGTQFIAPLGVSQQLTEVRAEKVSLEEPFSLSEGSHTFTGIDGYQHMTVQFAVEHGSGTGVVLDLDGKAANSEFAIRIRDIEFDNPTLLYMFLRRVAARARVDSLRVSGAASQIQQLVKASKVEGFPKIAN